MAISSGTAMAHHVCAYANDNIDGSDAGHSNTVDGYKFGIGGPTAYLQPVPTNGMGVGGGFYLSGMGAVLISGSDLYVNDAFTNDVTHFVIIQTNCNLMRDKTIYPSGDTTIGMGDGLAITPNGSFLYVASTGDKNIYLLATQTGGGLAAPTSVAITPDTPTSIAVSPDGQTLVVGYPNIQQVCAYPIGGDGTLGASNCQSTVGFPAAIAIDPASACVYAGEANTTASEAAAFSLTPGMLGTPVDYILGPGVNSSALLVNNLGTQLYISNQGSAQITTVTISAGCSLSYTTGNIITDGALTDSPGQLAQGGTLPFVVAGDYSSTGEPKMGLFRINGSKLMHYASGVHHLTHVTGNAPFSVVAIINQ